jgi:hypothetical protein
MLSGTSDLKGFFGTTKEAQNGHEVWNSEYQYRTRSLKTASRELAKKKLDLTRVQEVRWDKGGTEPADDYTFFYGNGNTDHHLGTGFLVHEGIVSAIKMAECEWPDITILNVHSSTADKCGDTKNSIYETLERVFDQFSEYHMNILLGNFNTKIGKEDIPKPTIGNESLHETSNDNRVRVANFATLKNVAVEG